MTAALLWLRAHKQFALVAGAILAVFTSGYCAGKRSVSQPAVHEVVQEQAKKDTVAVADVAVHAGPETITTTVEEWGNVYLGNAASDGCVFRGGCERRISGNGAPRKEEGPGVDRGLRAATDGSVLVKRIVTVDQRGPSVTETHAQAEVHEESTRKLDLTLSPAMLVRSLALGVEDPFGDKKLHIDAGVMVTQHLGVRLGWTPANGLLKGLTPMAEVRF